MRILGIDPGSRRIGYGVIETRPKLTLIEAGLIPIAATSDGPALVELSRELDSLIDRLEPVYAGVERLFFTKNRTTGIAVGQARGIILERIVARGIPVAEITPNEVKLGVTGSGKADKAAVAKMVRLTLGEHNLKLIDDAMDALAIAIVASTRARIPN
jgi:crossover junction endodeoxyribonuclease RuvC